MRPGSVCKPNVAGKLLEEIGKKFSENPKIQGAIIDPGHLLSMKFERMFDRPIEDYGSMSLTKGDIKAFDKEMNRVVKGIASGKMQGRIGSLLYSTEERVRNNPAYAKLYDDFLNINHNFKGRKIRHDNSYNRILESLRDEAISGEFYGKMSKKDFRKARKMANELEDEIFKLQVDAKNEVPGAMEKLGTAIEKQDRFLQDGEGKVFYDFVQLVETGLPKLEAVLRTEYLDKRRKEYEIAGKKEQWLTEDQIRSKLKPEKHFMKLTQSPYMRNALVEYISTMDDMYSVLQRGMDKYVQSIEMGMEAKGYDSNVLADIKKKIMEKIMPSQKTGYFPHYNYGLNVEFLDNLMPHMDQLAVSTRESFEGNTKSIDGAIKSINSYLTARAKPRALVKDATPEQYSMNFPVVLKRYIDEINRFNFVAHSQASTREALMLTKKMFRNGEHLDGYALDVVNQILDLNAGQTGVREIAHPEFDSAMRSLLNMEFVSKLGLNMRSGVRNASQSLLNYVFFGWKGIKEARKLYRNDRELERKVDLMMEEAGIRFEEFTPELQEIGAGETSFQQRVRVVSGEKGGYELEFRNPSKLDKLSKGTSWLAGKSGVIMRKVENMNRKATFRIAFASMYKSLVNDAKFVSDVSEGKYRDSDVKRAATTKARNYALRMTTMLHFDYSKISKSKLLQHPFGTAAFQFQHFAVKFFELNKNLLQKGWNDISAGDTLTEKFGTEDMSRVYRMGLAYFIAPAIATALTGVSVSNLVEHNTADKLKQLGTLFTGDDEEIKKAFYGRGPLSSLVTGPIFSDVLALGELMELWKMDEDGFLQLAVGYNDYGKATNDQKLYALLRILNTQLGRATYGSLPLLTSGHMGMALQQEIGLYSTSKVKEVRKDIRDGIETLSPELIQAMEGLMQEAQQHKKRAVRPLSRN